MSGAVINYDVVRGGNVAVEVVWSMSPAGGYSLDVKPLVGPFRSNSVRP